MNLSNQRIIYSDNGTLSDLSVNQADFRAGTDAISFVSAEDYLYIGSFLPFNHKWFEITSANVSSASISIDIWTGDEWTAAVDLIDQTSSGGVPMAQSARVRFKVHRDESWVREHESEDVDGLAALTSQLDDFYWIRFKWSADVTFTLKYTGHKFSDDTELYTWYPDLNNSAMKTSFASGKTDWDEQHFQASDIIIRDLRSKSLLWTADQILEPEVFMEAAVHKVAAIIYAALGEAYKEDFAKASKMYNEAINLEHFLVDKNRDAKLSTSERIIKAGYFTR